MRSLPLHWTPYTLVLAFERTTRRTELLQLLWQLFAEMPQVSLLWRGRAACSPAELVTLFLSCAYICKVCLLCHNAWGYAHLELRRLPAVAEGGAGGRYGAAVAAGRAEGESAVEPATHHMAKLVSFVCREVLEGATELRLMLCREKRTGTRVGTSVIAACGAPRSLVSSKCMKLPLSASSSAGVQRRQLCRAPGRCVQAQSLSTLGQRHAGHVTGRNLLNMSNTSSC